MLYDAFCIQRIINAETMGTGHIILYLAEINGNIVVTRDQVTLVPGPGVSVM